MTHSDVLSAPPLNFDLSPFTGLTREHWEHVADRLLDSVRQYAQPGNSLISLPGITSGSGPESDALEGFARSFLTAGFRLKGSPESDPHNLVEWYAEGLANGTDPASPGYWPVPSETQQAKVEAASIALVLMMTRRQLWDRLDDGVQQRIVDWMSTVIGGSYPVTNWVWFQIVVEEFLRSVGAPYSQEDLNLRLSQHESFVAENGWYSDGNRRAYDHYCGWALQLYPLLWTDLSDSEEARRLRPIYTDRFRSYIQDAAHLQGADGAPLIQGRSLIYRYATAAPLWVDSYCEINELKPGLVRRASSGMLTYFLDHGVPDERGLLSVGWHGEWDPMAQGYSGAASPYWASKGMLGLALPADHPVWTSAEEPLPVEKGDFALTMPAAGWLVSGTQNDGVVRIFNHGTDRASEGDLRTDSPLYARFGYSTATFPPLVGHTVMNPLDQSVVVLDEQGRASHRTGFQTLAVQEREDVLVGISRSRAHWVEVGDLPARDHGLGQEGPVTTGPWITVASVVKQGSEVRIIRLDGAHDADVAGSALRVGGWAVSGETVQVRGALAESGGKLSTMRNLAGLDQSGVEVLTDVTPLGQETGIPWLAVETPAEGVFYACEVSLRGSQVESAPRARIAELVGDSVTLTWDDGSAITVELPAPR